MNKLQSHLRSTFIAGIFAGVPIVVTVIIIAWIDDKTRQLAPPIFHREVPFLGIIVAVQVIYLIGLLVRSIVGRQLLAVLDTLLGKVPIIRSIYEAWKQVSFTPGGKEGMYARAVLIPVETGRALVLGLTSGQPLEGTTILPVFCPNSPNPITGRLYFVPQGDVIPLNITTDEALKLIVSTGNYIPANLAAALAMRSDPGPGPTA